MNLFKKVLKTGLAITILAQLSISCNMYEPKGTKNSDVASGSTDSSGTVDPSQIYTVTVETLSDGTGSKIPATITLAPAESQRVFAIGRDINGVFISLVTINWASVNTAVVDITFSKANTTVIYGKAAGSTTVTTAHKTLPVDDIDVNVSAYGAAYKLELSTNAADEDNIPTTATTIVTVRVLDQFDNLVANYDEPAGPPATTFAISFKDSTNASVRADETINFVNGVYSFNLTYTDIGAVTMRMLQVTGLATTLAITDNRTLTFVPATLHHFRIMNTFVTAATAGTNYSISLTAEDVNDNTITDYTGTVTFTSTPAIDVTVPSAYTFTAVDSGVATITSFTFNRSTYMTPAAGGNGTYAITLSAGAITTTEPAITAITVEHAPLSQILPALTDIPPFDSSGPTTTARAVGACGDFPSLDENDTVCPIRSKEKFGISVTLKDQYNNDIDDHTGVLTFSSTGTATLPTDYTFLDLDNGLHSFTVAATPLILKNTTATNAEQTVSLSTGGITSTFKMDVYPAVCPTGYISIPARTDTSTTQFCVAKYEMYDGGGYVQSAHSQNPYISILASVAFDKCEEILAAHANYNYETGTYALISNSEWMSIARNIELGVEGGSGTNPYNWYGSGALANTIYIGNSTNFTATPVQANSSDADSDGFYLTRGDATNSGTQRRTLHISGGTDVIWDFAGNASEWVDFDSTDTEFTSTFNNNCMNTIGYASPTFEFTSIAGTTGCENIDKALFAPLSADLDNNEGMGTWTGSIQTSGPIVRGGSYSTNEAAGLTISNASNSIYYDSSNSGNANELTKSFFTVKLNSQPTHDVTVALTLDNADCDTGVGDCPAADNFIAGTILPASLTFTTLNWDAAQTVTVTAAATIDTKVNTAVSHGLLNANIVPSSTDARYQALDYDLSIAWADAIGTTNYIIMEAIDKDSGEDGSTATYNVRLASDPGGDLDVSIVYVLGEPTDEITLSTDTLPFTTDNWSTNQQLVLTGVNDELYDGNILSKLDLTAPGYSGGFIQTQNLDNEPLIVPQTTGIYYFNVAGSAITTYTNVGFRCVYRPGDD